MADITLLSFIVLAFAAGVWCGNTYGSIDDMLERLKKALKG